MHLRNTGDHIGDQALQRTEDGDVLPATLPDCEGDLVDLALQYPDIDIGVSDVLRQCTTGTLHGDDA